MKNWGEYMKKIVVICLFLISCCFLTGCFGSKTNDVISSLKKAVEKAKAYHVVGELEIVNNEESYLYDVEVAYKDDDYFRVSLKNKTNNHEQIILKNETGVYVLTPSLNKSFKFQSEWPYNNSQSYLLQALVTDMDNDENKTVDISEDSTIVTTTVNYSNNKNLVSQKIYFDKKGDLKKVEVLNKDGNVKIKMTYKDIDYKASYDSDYFNLDANMNVTSTTEQTLSEIEDIIYPMYMPENTYLTSEDVISLEDGERVILTFSGESPFMIVQETVSIDDTLTSVPVYGEIEWTGDTLGVMTDNTINWISNGVEYYVVSDALESSELLEIVNSISAMPVGK